MIKFKATIKKFEKMGEKTGWSYIEIPIELSEKLKPGYKQSFRVKGKLDQFEITGVALTPMGEGHFIMSLNADLRKGIGKRAGAELQVQIQVDNNPNPVSSPEFMECLADEPEAQAFFKTLAKGHQNYFMKWIESAKTAPTKTKRIAMAVTALARKMGYPEMIRANKDLN
ncbi:YdeI/OmpD-associated family protein [Chitinophaga sancti]|uniref:Bacteriocin-protection, YdeI or OmpD-Associated n=1 Tax=Chitinophaga sancti TaxID=1004 RepID=A0A1K1S7A5_9BACT|nr:YdeI/OmpD-associated family protein [Chitinophaga sancti]WQD62157.1 YdeI/OmpD-associated family protein [Chitinophaga sancti]WQG92274.1 YdeI/OmpD-associated family protein [Chitinophaga sancti]SFW80206.1 Bacteriocin-protection, YdeI or OmpD-Associated [Chitinophaga sancti]